MRNRYPGYCHYCGEWVNKQQGHFERIKGRRGWSLIHASCVQERRLFKAREQLEVTTDPRLRTELQEEIDHLIAYKKRIDLHDGKFEQQERRG
jgi:hypothetical protein